MTNINTFQGKVGIGMNTPGAPLEVQGPNMNDAAAGTSNVISRQSAGHDGVLNTIAVCTGSGEETIGLQTQIDGREYLTDVEAGWNYGNAGRYDLLLQPYKGNVGIGTTNPTSMLEVGNGGSASSGSAPGSITVTGTGATKSTGGKPGLYHRAGVGLGLWTDAHMTMEVNGTSGSPLEAMRIKSDGKLGIGTTAPLSRLVVTQDFGSNGPGVPLANVVADDGGVQFGIHVGEKVASPFTRTPLRVVDSGETVLIVDGHNKRVGIGTTAPTNVLTVRGVSGKAFAMSDLRSNAVVKVQSDYDAHDGLFIGLIDRHSTLNGDNPSPYLQSNWDGSASARPLLINPLGGGVGIGTLDPTGDLEVHGTGQATFTTFNQAGALGGTIVLRDDAGSSGSGGAVMFGTNNGFHAAIKANLVDGSNNTAGDLSFYTRSATTDGTMSHAMTIRNNNNVGIGVTDPGAKLQVFQNTLGGTAGNSTDIFKFGGDSGGPGALLLTSERVSNGSNWTTTALRLQKIVDVTKMGYIQFGTNSGNSTGELIFGNGDATERMRITPGGNVGIGTNAPDSLLNLYKNTTNGATMKFTSSSGYNTQIGQKSSSTADRSLQFTSNGYAGANAAFKFLTAGASSGYTDALTITGDGLVGIGTGAPSCRLHVFRPDHGLSARIGGYDGVLDIGTLPTTYGAETVYLQTKIDGGTGYVGERQVLSIQADVGGRVGIGSTTPTCKLDLNHNAPQLARFYHTSSSRGAYISVQNQTGTNALFGADGQQFITNETNSIGLYNGSTGNISYYCNGQRRAYLATNGLFYAQGFGIYSDERIKDNITDVDDAESLEIIKQLQPKNYVMRENRDEKQWGFIAQDVEKILPESITIDQEQLMYIRKKYDITEYNPSVKLSDTVYSNVSVTEHSNLDIDTQQYYIGPDTTNTYYSNIVTEAVYSKSNVSALITDEAFDVGDCVQLSIDETYSLNVCFLNVASVSNNVYVFQDECVMTANDHDLVDMNLTDSIYLKSKKLKDGKAIDYEFMNPILVSAVQQLLRIVDDLKERVTVLENT